MSFKGIRKSQNLLFKGIRKLQNLSFKGIIANKIVYLRQIT